jgi:predicted CopG family antitoxin
MVKVITIMDDIYVDLYKIKRSKNMSFSELFRYLLKERKEGTGSIISLAGRINPEDIDGRAVDRIKRETVWNR